MMETRVVQASLYEVAQSTSCEDFQKELENVQNSTGCSLLEIVNQLSFDGNSLLHVAARSGGEDITKYLAQNFPHLIFRTNYVGDTVLHSAIKAGKAETTKVLLQFLTNPDVVSMLRKKNLEGNTILHEVVIQYKFVANNGKRDSYRAIATEMVSVDPGLAYIANNMEKSPLCLAVETTDLKIVQCLLQYPLPVAEDCQQLPEGKSPVHVAIKLKLKNNEILREMLHERPNLIDSKNRKGRKALHYAASTGNMGAIDFLLQNFPQTITERDKDGHCALHGACESGYVEAFNMLLRWLPHSLEWLNNKKQNVLHIAAKNGRDHMVRHIVKDEKLGPQLVNATDDEGNTPLHLAAMHGHSLVVGTLLLTRKCNSETWNQDRLTAYEVAEKRALKSMDSGRQMGRQNMQSSEQCNVQNNEHTNVQHEDVSLKNTKRPDSIDSMMALSILFLFQKFKILCGHRQQHQMRKLGHEMIIKGPNEKDIKDRSLALGVVATLIATIAFQAATQIRENGNDKCVSYEAPTPAPAPTTSRLPSWVEHIILPRVELIYPQIFTFFISLAMNLSIFAATTLCWIQLLDVNISDFFVWKASILVGASLYSICIAFGFNMLIGIKKFGATYATVTIVFEVLFIPVLTVFTTPLFIPLHLKILFVRVLYVAFFIGYFIVHRLLDYCLCQLWNMYSSFRKR